MWGEFQGIWKHKYCIDSACWFCSQLFSDCQLQKPDFASLWLLRLYNGNIDKLQKHQKNHEHRSQAGTLQPAQTKHRITDRGCEMHRAGNNEKFAEELLCLPVCFFCFVFVFLALPYQPYTEVLQWKYTEISQANFNQKWRIGRKQWKVKN